MSAVETNLSAVGGRQRLAVGRNTLILLATNFSSAAFGLLISILIARNAGDAALGSYSLALAWSLTLAQFADLGMNTLLTRDLARQPEDTALYVRASLIAKSCLAAVLAAGLWLAAPLIAPGADAATAIQLGSALIFLNAWYGTFTAVLRASGRMLPILYLNGGGLALQTALTWFLLAQGWGVNALVLLAVAIQGIQLLGGAFVTRRHYPASAARGRVDRETLRRMLTAALPFAVAGIIGSVELRANLFMLGWMEQERVVGWYSAAARVTDGIRLAPNAFFGALLPALTALTASGSRPALRRLFVRAQLALGGFGLALAALLTAVGPPLLVLAYGSAFEPAAPALVLLSWDLVPALWVGLLTLLLYAQNQERRVNLWLALGLGIQVAAAYALIPPFGAAGAAAAALVSDVTLCLILMWFALPYLKPRQ